MIANGTLFITNDMNLAVSSVNQNTKILMLTESVEYDHNAPDLISGVCLLPPPMAKIAENDGDAQRFYGIYTEYLLSDVPVDFFAIILSYLYKGGNFVLYTESDLSEPWVSALLNHILMYYGITTATAANPPGYDMNFNNSNANIVYNSRNMDWKQYLLEFDTTKARIPDHLLEKLYYDSGVIPHSVSNPSVAIDIFNQLSVAFKKSPNSEVPIAFR